MKLKTIFIIFSLISPLIIVNVPGVAEVPATKFYVDPPSIIDPLLVPGKNFTVNIMVANVSDLYTWQFYLNWTATIVSVTGVYEGPFLSSNGTYATYFAKRVYNDKGYLWASCTLSGEPASSAAKGSGVIATVNFTVLATGSTLLDLCNTQLLEVPPEQEEIPHITEDGYFSNGAGEVHDISILTVSISSTSIIIGQTLLINVSVKNEGTTPESFNISVYYASSLIATRTNISLPSGATITLSFNWSTIGVPPSQYTIKAQVPPLPGEVDTADNTYNDGIVTVKLPDVNGDGKINVFDLGPLGKALGSTIGDPNYDPAVDYNNDGIIDSTDLYLLQISWGYGS